MNPYINSSQQPKPLEFQFNILRIGLTAPRQDLNEKINIRVLTRLNQGMIEEARGLYKKGLPLKRMRQLGLEYGILADYLTGKITKDQLIKLLEIKIHQYAKRQMTWFKKEHNVVWFDISKKDYIKKVEKRVLGWYNEFHVSKKS
jgi:tRNA dimethylallyltransferase